MYTKTTSIKLWAEDDRPREKMLNKGRAALSNAELLAIVLGSGTQNKSAVEVAQDILQSADNNLYKLGKFSVAELMRFPGIGKARAITIMAVLELGRRRAASQVPINPKVTKAAIAYDYVKSYFQDLDYEEFRIIGLSRGNRIIESKLISKGGRSGTVADGKLIFKELLDMKASGCILVHNHPSGRLFPSSQDISLTKRYVQFGQLIDLPVVDHLIVTDTGFYSFAENGRI